MIHLGNDAKEFISNSLKNDCKSFIFDNKYDYVFFMETWYMIIID